MRILGARLNRSSRTLYPELHHGNRANPYFHNKVSKPQEMQLWIWQLFTTALSGYRGYRMLTPLSPDTARRTYNHVVLEAGRGEFADSPLASSSSEDFARSAGAAWRLR
jgi:hypothetical protein